MSLGLRDGSMEMYSGRALKKREERNTEIEKQVLSGRMNNTAKVQRHMVCVGGGWWVESI